MSSGPDTHYELPRQSPQRAPLEHVASAGPAIEATVKWFNQEKGFGFVELADGSGDVFLHISVLQSGGHDTVLPESKLRVQVGQGQKGRRQVTAILEVDASGAPVRARPSSSAKMSAGRERLDHPSTASDMQGTVKWFNSEKGFGFVSAEDGGKDVFIHISIVERAGLRAVEEGQRLAMKVVRTQKGREVISLSLIE